MAAAVEQISSSPTAWPIESFTYLKLSRSSTTTAPASS